MLIFHVLSQNATSLRMIVSAASPMDAHTSRRKGRKISSCLKCLLEREWFTPGRAIFAPPPTTTAALYCSSLTPKPMEGQGAAVSSTDFPTLVVASFTGK